MQRLTFDISMSLDGFIAAPRPTLERPLGEGGARLHEIRVVDSPGIAHLEYRVVK